jgi:hypothetical protein
VQVAKRAASVWPACRRLNLRAVRYRRRSGALRAAGDYTRVAEQLTGVSAAVVEAARIKGGAVDIPICMSKASVSRDLITVLWRRLCLQPRRTEGFKFSTGPQLAAGVRDVVGLYLAPPGNAVVVCVDEKPRSRRRNGRSWCCLCARASPSGLPTTRSGTAPPLYPPPWR